jgi:Flp pilus assembly protein TadB
MKRFIFGTVLCFSLFGMVGNVHAKDESKFEKRVEQAAEILTKALKCGPSVPCAIATTIDEILKILKEEGVIR